MKQPKAVQQSAKSRKSKGKMVFDQAKEVRAIARERLGTAKPGYTIVPKDLRKKPKHKKPLGQEDEH